MAAAMVGAAAAMAGAVAPVPAIFVANSRYNWSDVQKIEIAPRNSMLDDFPSTEELLEKVQYILDVDGEDDL